MKMQTLILSFETSSFIIKLTEFWFGDYSNFSIHNVEFEIKILCYFWKYFPFLIGVLLCYLWYLPLSEFDDNEWLCYFHVAGINKGSRAQGYEK